MNGLSTPPLGLYVHLPWCVRKCPYCDFNSHELRDELPETRYVEALLRDLEQDLPRVWGRSVVSIFLGGGTPSLFSPAALDHLLSGIAARLPVAPGAEVTMEANPGTLEHAPLAEYRAAGINRLSLGVQSFNDDHLKAIGRIHSAQEVHGVLAGIADAGFDSFNLDLMYALPDQSLASAVQDVEIAIDYGPAHLSHYQLTLEPNTRFHADPPELPDHDRAWQMQEACQARLAEAGYEHYEVSAYARGDARSRHNLNYWQFGDYLGIGAGAHGKITDPGRGTIERLWKQRHPRTYLETAGSEASIGAITAMEGADRQFEFVLNAFRLTEGVPADWFEHRTGLALDPEAGPWREARQRGWLEPDSAVIRATEAGQRFLNDLTLLFLPDA